MKHPTAPFSRGPLIERVLSYFAPRRARQVRHLRMLNQDSDYREAHEALQRQILAVRGYRGASRDGHKWTAMGRSADSEIMHDLPALRNRSRELARDDSIGSGILNTFVANVVGGGFQPQAHTGDRDTDRALEQVWAERADALSAADGISHVETQHLLYRRVLEDGDVIRKAVVTRPGEPLWFENVEADRLATPPSSGAGNWGIALSHEVRDGVERDGYGRPVAYWIMKRHPGDGFGNIGASTERDNWVRVPAVACRHLRFVERPGQTRGVPLLHAVLTEIRDMDLIIVAALKRCQIAACLAVFIKSSVEPGEFVDSTLNTDGSYEMDQELKPGLFWHLNPGEDVNTLTPNFPTPELDSFLIQVARRIGAALGVPWQMVLKDFSKSNYSSARTDLLEARRVFEHHQRWFANTYLRWEWSEVMRDAALRGDSRVAGLPPEALGAVHWIAPGWRWVDPVKEAQGAALQVENNMGTLQEICAGRGLHWEDVLEQRVIERARQAELEAKYGVAPTAKPDEEDEDDEDEGNSGGSDSA